MFPSRFDENSFDVALLDISELEHGPAGRFVQRSLHLLHPPQRESKSSWITTTQFRSRRLTDFLLLRHLFKFYRTATYYISQVISTAPVALVEAFLLSVLSFFAVGMNNHRGWGFLYFWLQSSLISLNGTSVARMLAYGLPTESVAQTLGPAFLLLFILATGYSPQYKQLPLWLRWVAWLSPCAYTYEGVIVNEVFERSVGDFSGFYYAQTALGIPRIHYAGKYCGVKVQPC